ncbi:hypothetical protein CRE_14195 [Caenorhabditis remanei]|uniref:Uncharacterized protein n=1 Tax=Caenorhabditis remanei TaxID=31234 RepID=E3N1L3_CAERE|nr:hypothetical protein CRE_14195 [Caenorhabditis remanei]
MSFLSSIFCYQNSKTKDEINIFCCSCCYSSQKIGVVPRQENILTSYPIIPKLLETTSTTFQVLVSPMRHKLGFTYASEGSKLANFKSLELIRRSLLKWETYYPEFLTQLQNPFPRNTVAITLCKPNFGIGNSCQEIYLVEKDSPELIETQSDAFSYQQLTENVHATYFNQDGIQFLAGLCYYPFSSNSKSLKNDETAIFLALAAAEPYPLSNRNTSENRIHYNVYGRYCSKAGKRVAVHCKDYIFHIEAETESRRNSQLFKYVSCEECSEEAMNYKWEDPVLVLKEKIVDGYPITDEPYVPTVMKYLYMNSTVKTNKKSSCIHIQYAEESKVLSSRKSLDMVRGFLLDQFDDDLEGIDYLLKEPLPRNTIAVSFGCNGFHFNRKTFELSSSEITENANDVHLTYQQLSENVQVTYHNENGIRYLAGISYYPAQIGKSELIENDYVLMFLADLTREPYPTFREKNYFIKLMNALINGSCGRYCERSGKRVAVDCMREYGHIDYDHVNNEYLITPCRECMNHFQNRLLELYRNPHLQDQMKSQKNEEKTLKRFKKYWKKMKPEVLKYLKTLTVNYSIENKSEEELDDASEKILIELFKVRQLMPL